MVRWDGNLGCSFSWAVAIITRALVGGTTQARSCQACFKRPRHSTARRRGARGTAVELAAQSEQHASGADLMPRHASPEEQDVVRALLDRWTNV